MQQIIKHGSWDAAAKAANVNDLEEASIPGVRKIKGISKMITKNEMTMQDYRTILHELDPRRHVMNTIRSRNHTIHIESLEKTSLSILEDKRLVSLKQ